MADLVEMIDTLKKVITTSEESIEYSQIVLAAGSIPKFPKVSGLPNYAFIFYSFEDIARPKELIDPCQKS